MANLGTTGREPFAPLRQRRVFRIETEAPVILEPGRPCFFEGLGAPYLCPRPVLEDDVVMEKIGDFIDIVFVPRLVPSGQ